MSILPLNDPAIFACSLRFTFYITELHAHIRGEEVDFPSLSAAPLTCEVWLYFPLHQGERVTEIWKRQHPIDARAQALMVSVGIHAQPDLPLIDRQFGTSEGRFISTAACRTYRTCELLDRPGAGRSYLFFETSRRGVRHLAFETLHREPIVTPPSVPSPSSVPQYDVRETFFYTWAILDSVRTVRPCYMPQDGIRIVTAFLFSDANGEESCVDQVRYGCLDSPKGVGNSEKLRLGFSLETWKSPRVIGIEMADSFREVGNPGLHWFEVSWKGKLEWWFSYRQCRVYHEGRASPQTRFIG